MPASVPTRTAIGFRLALDPRHAAALKRHALLAGRPAKRTRQIDVYYDTRDLQLYGGGLALRMQRAGGRWLQVLQAGERGAAGLHEYDEWEFALPGPDPDPGLLAGTPFAELPADGRTLVPAFTARIVRTAWEVVLDAPGRIEIMLDQGSLVCRGSTLPICEVRLALLEGPFACIFDAAAILQRDDASLRPESDSMAQRGYRLLRRNPLRPVRAEPVSLDARMTLPAALRQIVRCSLAQLHANERGVSATEDGEFLHQARVALRRLRSALKFAGAAGAAPDGIQAELKWLFATLGPARDWDVLLNDTLPPAMRACGDAAQARRATHEARRQRKATFVAAREALGSPRYFALLREISRWLFSQLPQGVETSAAAFAAMRIGKRHKRLLRDAAALAEQTPQQRHRVRIDAKRLRYAAEHFASLFHGKSVRRYLRTLSALQDALGAANDAATAERLLEQLPLADLPREFVRGWLAARNEGNLAHAQDLVARLGKRKRFWA